MVCLVMFARKEHILEKGLYLAPIVRRGNTPMLQVRVHVLTVKVGIMVQLKV